MRQLLLDLGAQQPQTLESFVTGRNEQLMQQMHQIATRSSAEHFAYLWGEPASGRTHLLHALGDLPATRFIPANAEPEAFAYSHDISLYLLDDCNALSPESQIAAFSLFNQVRDHDGFMVSTGNAAPATLAVREDLRSRMGWGLVYQVHRLTDEEKITALTQSAQARGFTLSPGVLPYLITHYHRDMRSLSAMFDALDRYSLETKRAITLPLLRELLQLDASSET
jgi:DnaA-homolog protein